MNRIVERIEHELSLPGLSLLLAERLTPTDLQSLLLEVYRLRNEPDNLPMFWRIRKRVLPEFCFHIHAMNSSGQWLELVDGGVVGWTQRLLSNAKERLVISGVGSESLCPAF